MRRKVTVTATSTTPKIVGPWTIFGMKIIRRDKAGNVTHASYGTWNYPTDKFPSFKDAVANFESKQGQPQPVRCRVWFVPGGENTLKRT